MPLRTIVYLRKSTQDKDEKQVHSIMRQKRDIEEYVQRNNEQEKDPGKRLYFDPEKDLLFEDSSAKETGRKVFNAMAENIKKNKYDVLLCTELSRLSRNAVDNGTLVVLLENHLQQIRTIDKIFKPIPSDVFMFSILLLTSKYENDVRALNTQSGMRHRQHMGATTYKAPLGYINKGDKKGEKWVAPDSDNFDSARKLWDMLLADSFTLLDIRNASNEMGLTLISSKGKRKPPSKSTIRNMFSNKYYMGKIKTTDEHGQEIWVQGTHQPMVTEKEFEKAQLVLQKNGYKHAKIDKAPNIELIIKEIAISGIYKVKTPEGKTRPAAIIFEEKTRYTCSHCKHRYYSVEPKNCPKCNTEVNRNTRITEDKRFSHHTETKKKKDSIKLDIVAEQLKQQFDKLYISEGLFSVLRKQLYTLWLNKNKNIQKKRGAIKDEISKLENEEASLLRKQLQEESNTKREDMDIALTNVRDELEEKEEELKELRETHEEIFEKAWQSLQVLKDAKEILTPTMKFEPKKRLILSLCSNLVFYKDKIQVVWKKPFDIIAQQGFDKDKNSQPNPTSGENSSIGSPAEQLVRTIITACDGIRYPITMDRRFTLWEDERKQIQREIAETKKGSPTGK